MKAKKTLFVIFLSDEVLAKPPRRWRFAAAVAARLTAFGCVVGEWDFL